MTDQERALLRAAESGQRQDLEAALASGVNIDVEDGEGCTALMRAVSGVRLGFVKLLLARGAKVIVNPGQPRTVFTILHDLLALNQSILFYQLGLSWVLYEANGPFLRNIFAMISRLRYEAYHQKVAHHSVSFFQNASFSSVGLGQSSVAYRFVGLHGPCRESWELLGARGDPSDDERNFFTDCSGSFAVANHFHEWRLEITFSDWNVYKNCGRQSMSTKNSHSRFVAIVSGVEDLDVLNKIAVNLKGEQAWFVLVFSRAFEGMFHQISSSYPGLFKLLKYAAFIPRTSGVKDFNTWVAKIVTYEESAPSHDFNSATLFYNCIFKESEDRESLLRSIESYDGRIALERFSPRASCSAKS